jgi:hypothetical protein
VNRPALALGAIADRGIVTNPNLVLNANQATVFQPGQTYVFNLLVTDRDGVCDAPLVQFTMFHF